MAMRHIRWHEIMREITTFQMITCYSTGSGEGLQRWYSTMEFMDFVLDFCSALVWRLWMDDGTWLCNGDRAAFIRIR